MNPVKSSLLSTIALFVIITTNIVYGQRSPYAGQRPSGYKDRLRPEQEATTEEVINRFGEDFNRPQKPPVGVQVVQPSNEYFPLPDTTNNELGNRGDFIGQNNIPTTTSRLPYDALGDKELVDRLNRLPADKRPFWLLNAQAIEAQRNGSGSVGNFNPVAQRGSFSAGVGSFNTPSGGNGGLNNNNNPTLNQRNSNFNQNQNPNTNQLVNQAAFNEQLARNNANQIRFSQPIPVTSGNGFPNFGNLNRQARFYDSSLDRAARFYNPSVDGAFFY